MTVTITLPDDVKAQLQREAEAQDRSVEEVALGILSGALRPASAFPAPEDVVAKIKATAPDPHNIRFARGSLAAALRAAPDDSDFDLVQWEREWAAVEREMKAMTRANDVAEGRG
jgi:plasmid stability protein